MKYIIDIPEIPKNDKQRWVVANGTPYEDRPHGEWIEHLTCVANLYFASGYECSNCHDDVFQKTKWQFCPNCGADMRKNGEENEPIQEDH